MPMQSIRRLVPALLLPFALVAAAQGDDIAKVQIKTTRLADHVYMLVGAGGNIGLSVGDDAVFMIDDQFAPLVPKIKAAVAELTPKPLKFVLNTHFHFDHTGGNDALGRDGAVIIAHDNVLRRLSSDQVMAFIGAKQTASAHAGLPVLTVPGDITLHLNGDEIHAFHAPMAHTDGDLIVHFRKADVIHMGDTFFNGFYPFIDFDNGGSAAGVVAAADQVLALATERTKIIPGHGPLATRADLLAYREMLASVAGRIRALRAEGRSDDQIAAATPSAAFDAAWGGGFIKPEKFVTMMLGATGQ
ncbi:MAG: MBL fold metallo-hydrolase [Rubrivivax sp.]